MKLYFKQVADSMLKVKADPRNECFNFGIDNAFPSLIEALIGMSVTAKTCTDRTSKAIYGASFGEIGKVIVNSKKQSLNEVLRIAARQYSKHNNCYLQISYNGEFEVKAIVVVHVTDVRVGKADDKGYSGKFIVYDNWDKSKGKKIDTKGFELYDRFNPDKAVIEKQVKDSGKKKGQGVLSDYNGQILHIKKDETYVYSLPELSPVLSEALLESNSQTFRSRGAEKGFLNTKLLVVPPFKDDKARRDFKKGMDGFKGAENSSETLLLETSQNSDDVSKQIHLDDLSGEYNDELFEYSDKQAEKDICKAYSVSIVLIDPTDSGSLGDSGGKMEEAKTQLWESREEDRKQFEEVFSELMNLFSDKKIEADLIIKNPYIDEDDAKEAKNVNKKAQANLRGSVGGVTALASLISSVNRGEVTKESAIAVIKSIYGFSDAKAKEMVGGFDDEETV